MEVESLAINIGFFFITFQYINHQLIQVRRQKLNNKLN